MLLIDSLTDLLLMEYMRCHLVGWFLRQETLGTKHLYCRCQHRRIKSVLKKKGVRLWWDLFLLLYFSWLSEIPWMVTDISPWSPRMGKREVFLTKIPIILECLCTPCVNVHADNTSVRTLLNVSNLSFCLYRLLWSSLKSSGILSTW